MSKDRKMGALVGLAVGDALGTTFEFRTIEQAAYPALASGPADDVVGGGPFRLAPGQVTDDTQMAVCLARSLRERGGFDDRDVARRYVEWSEHAFDIGNQTGAAIGRIRDGEEGAGLAVWRANDRRPAGNGSLMRTAPLAVVMGGEALIDAAMEESMITHADPRCVLACAAFDAAIGSAIGGGAIVEVARRAIETGAARLGMEEREEVERARVALLGDLDAAEGGDPGVYGAELHVHRTAGFVRVAFRLAFWHAVHTPWREAVVDVASRGGDADTNAAIVGALLGARDGIGAIPEAWIERVMSATQPGPKAWAEAHHPRHLLALIA